MFSDELRCNVKKKEHCDYLAALLCNWHLLNGLTHVQTHFHTVLSVVGQGLWQAGHTVVTVTKDFDSHTFIFLHRHRWKIRSDEGTMDTHF